MHPRTQKTFREVLAASFFLAAILILASHYRSLPAQIHTPINGGGDAHGMGSRDHLWLLIFLGGWIYALMSLFNLMPVEAVNSPRPLKPPQRLAALEGAKALLGWLKVVLMAGLCAWIILLVR